MTQTKDYSLLRAFDLGQAKEGDGILYMHHRTNDVYVEVTYRGCSRTGFVFVEYENGNGRVVPKHEITMKPLAWVEGKPVYKGNTLYLLKDRNYFTVRGLYKDMEGVVLGLDGSLGWTETEALTWNKKHVHQELINAKNTGARIQHYAPEYNEWLDCINNDPMWNENTRYRIKPKEKTKKSGWINLWLADVEIGVSTGFTVYRTKKGAVDALGSNPRNHVATAEIHWEE
jgi:hypothetical protein